jgi:integrase
MTPNVRTSGGQKPSGGFFGLVFYWTLSAGKATAFGGRDWIIEFFSAVQKTGPAKRISAPTFRHSFATRLLRRGVDIRLSNLRATATFFTP